MESLWSPLANIVLAIHIGLFVAIAAGLLPAALGKLRQYPRISLTYWVTLALAVGWQAIPGCPLTSLEYWLRSHVTPDPERALTLLRTVIEAATPYTAPPAVDTLFPLALAGIAVYAFGRYHAAECFRAAMAVLRWRGLPAVSR